MKVSSLHLQVSSKSQVLVMWIKLYEILIISPSFHIWSTREQDLLMLVISINKQKRDYSEQSTNNNQQHNSSKTLLFLDQPPPLPAWWLPRAVGLALVCHFLAERFAHISLEIIRSVSKNKTSVSRKMEIFNKKSSYFIFTSVSTVGLKSRTPSQSQVKSFISVRQAGVPHLCWFQPNHQDRCWHCTFLQAKDKLTLH